MNALALTLLTALPPLALGAAPPAATVDFLLRDAAGKTHRLADWSDRRAVVLVFLALDCPLARQYAPRLVELARRYERRGVAVVMVASRQETPRDLARFVRRHGVPFPVLRDTGGVAARRFGAVRSPEAFVVDRGQRVRYRGRIDDQYAVGVQRPAVRKSELVDAVEAILAGRPVAVPVTSAPGCPLGPVEAAVDSARVTYCRDVVRILQRRCQACHRPEQSAPFSLLTYRDARTWAPALREVVEEGRMPPWGADPRHGTFANSPALEPTEKETLLAWVDAGCPEGDRADLPPSRNFPTGWAVRPDAVIEMPGSFTVPAEGSIEYQYIRVDPSFTEDRWVTAAEIRPGNPAVVHHCNVFLQPPGLDDPEDLSEAGKLGSYCLTMMAQGTPPMVLPEGMAKRIPAGWRIVFVVHYQAVGSIQTDRTSLALTFADPRTVRREVATRLLYEADLRIAPGQADYRVTKSWTFPADMLLLSFFPHMHLRGKSFRYELAYPDGRREVLLDVPRFDFAWQHRYVLAEPLRVPAGSELFCHAVYDNSADNPANPDPGAEVRAGTQSWEEMFNGYFDVCLADEDLTRPRAWHERWREGAGRQRGVLVLAGAACGLFLIRRRIGRALGGGRG